MSLPRALFIVASLALSLCGVIPAYAQDDGHYTITSVLCQKGAGEERWVRLDEGTTESNACTDEEQIAVRAIDLNMQPGDPPVEDVPIQEPQQ